MKQTSIELLKQDLDAELKLGTKMVVNWDMYIEMHKQEMTTNCSQQEISDEEIEKFADEELGTIRTDFDFGVIQGMKWYREQLKHKL